MSDDFVGILNVDRGEDKNIVAKHAVSLGALPPTAEGSPRLDKRR